MEMRKHLALAVAGVVVAAGGASAQVARRTAGITLRGSVWDLRQGQQRLIWQSDEQHRLFDGDGAGGWISFTARASSNLALELSLGGVVRRMEEVKHAQGTDKYTEALVPLLIGGRIYPFVPRRGTPLLLYVSAGAGPYWMGDIVEIDRGSDEDVSVDGRYLFGGYLGAGVDFMFTDWMGLNIDMKRHYVDFTADQEHSGLEFAAGLTFMWGDHLRR